jgi:signal transduction histidine kinase
MNEKGLRLELHSAGPVEVIADAAMLHRMVSNLLDNEMKHLPPSRTVTVAVTEESNWAQLIIEDDGPGFSPDIEPDLFKPRVKGSDSRGYGLGLAFVQAVAGAHGGSTVAENREGGGARLIVRLPLAAESTRTPMQAASAD